MTTTAILALSLTAGILLTGALIGIWALADKRTTRRRRVSISLRSGETITGVIWARHLRYYHLKDAMFYDGRNQITLDGDVILELEHVAFTQLLPTTDTE